MGFPVSLWALGAGFLSMGFQEPGRFEVLSLGFGV